MYVLDQVYTSESMIMSHQSLRYYDVSLLQTFWSIFVSLSIFIGAR